MCDLDYGYMGFTRNIIKIKGKTVQYDDMSIESACENENNVLLLNRGKNLLNLSSFTPISNPDIQVSIDKDVITFKGLKSPDGEVYTTPRACNLKVYLEQNKTYSFSFKSDGEFGATSGTDTVELLFMLEGTTQNYFNILGQKTVTIPRGFGGYYYIRFDINSGDKTHKFWDIQVEEGNIITDYEPYRNQTNIDLPHPLRSLPNGVCDTIEGNKLIQRVGKVIITKQDNVSWLCYNNNSYGLNLFVTYISAFGLAGRGDNKLPSVVSDKFVARADSGWESEKNPFRCFMNSNGKIHFLMDKAEFPTVTEFNNWLEENPTTVYYELATPIEHTIDINIKKIKKSKCYNKIKPTII